MAVEVGSLLSESQPAESAGLMAVEVGSLLPGTTPV